jgi:hypothetical protein
MDVFLNGTRISVFIPRSRDDLEYLWSNDPEIVRDLIAVGVPVTRLSADCHALDCRDGRASPASTALSANDTPPDQTA